MELAALGATPEAITRLRQSQQKGRNATSRAVAGLIDTLAPNSPSARAAIADLERQVAENRRSTEVLLGNGKLPVVVEKDGGWTVYDPVSGQEIGRATTPEGAASIVNQHVWMEEGETSSNKNAPTPQPPPIPILRPPVVYFPPRPVVIGRRRDPSQPRPSTFSEAMKLLGLDQKIRWSLQDLADLREMMRVDNPANEADHIDTITVEENAAGFTEADIRQCVQDFFDILPENIAKHLPKVSISLVNTMLDGSKTKGGEFTIEGGACNIAVTTANKKYLSAQDLRYELRRLFAHEIMYWVHISPKGDASIAYRKAISRHHRTRMKRADGGGWHDDYAGKSYPPEEREYKCRGFEVPTRYYELWENLGKLAFLMDLTNGKKAVDFRETFIIINSIFNQP